MRPRPEALRMGRQAWSRFAWSRMVLLVCGLLWVLLGGATVHAEPGATGEASLEMVHEDRLGPGSHWELVSVEYLLDGRALPSVAPGEASSGARYALPLGLRWLDVSAIYVGRSSVFSYVEGYRFVMRARVTLDARPGDSVRITSTAYAKDGITVQWQQRPSFLVMGQPHEAVVGIEYGPAMNAPLPEDVAARVVDEVLAEARRRSARPPAATAFTSDELPVTCVLAPVFFDFFDTRISGEGEQALLRAAECLQRRPHLRVRLQGHADVMGPESVNTSLGLGRAQSVAAMLQSMGIEGSRLYLETRGAELPPCDDGTPGCFARSRRVELVAEPSPP
ncbi:OmpA family protein [Myxococcus landrumensis]|uniref:OmpA family protein n=1 Tax=Myxococcus landrumensis TaxID=2813577 RepID=A0ABX7NCL1_9BACT|nr:OmpA family protein [Myxococcus landrumus]QSQ16527.1 OmpA family protein [Myxococcus landrumus]